MPRLRRCKVTNLRFHLTQSSWFRCALLFSFVHQFGPRLPLFLADLEWDSFSGYRTQGKTALAQVCDEKTILLIHVARMKRFPPALQRLAEDPTRIKLGVQIAGDASKLQRDFSIRSQGTLDINALVHHYDPSRYVGRQRKGLIGLQELTGLYLDRFLRKETAVRTGRWSAALGAEQMECA